MHMRVPFSVYVYVSCRNLMMWTFSPEDYYAKQRFEPVFFTHQENVLTVVKDNI